MKSHRFTPGKVEDVDGGRDKLMGALTKRVQEAIKDYGAGDQMVRCWMGVSSRA